jgi:hypothetical protein
VELFCKPDLKNQLLLTQNMVGRRFAACSYFEKNARKSTKLVDVPVSLAMRYGNPSLLSGLQELHDKGVTEVLLFLCIRNMLLLLQS